MDKTTLICAGVGWLFVALISFALFYFLKVRPAMRAKREKEQQTPRIHILGAPDPNFYPPEPKGLPDPEIRLLDAPGPTVESLKRRKKKRRLEE